MFAREVAAPRRGRRVTLTRADAPPGLTAFSADAPDGVD